jgi:hypothetical protein
MEKTNFSKLIERIKEKRPRDLLETKTIGKAFKEVRTTLPRKEVTQLCKGLGKVLITEE